MNVIEGARDQLPCCSAGWLYCSYSYKTESSDWSIISSCRNLSIRCHTAGELLSERLELVLGGSQFTATSSEGPRFKSPYLCVSVLLFARWAQLLHHLHFGVRTLCCNQDLVIWCWHCTCHDRFNSLMKKSCNRCLAHKFQFTNWAKNASVWRWTSLVQDSRSL